jgi:flavin-dependent dehydrogenase
MKNNDCFYKTIIIGAGPAGLTAGINLKNDFLILEKEKQIGKPIQCVGMSVDSFKRQNIAEDEKWIKAKIYKIERIMPNNKKLGRYKKNYIGYVVERESFEKHLAKKIKSRIRTNINIIDLFQKNNLWHVITDNNVFKSKYLIGADGINSFVRKKVFPQYQEKICFAFGMEYLVQFNQPINLKSIKFYLNNEKYNKGYGWFFPRSEFSANIGVGSENENLDFNQLLEQLIDQIEKSYGSYSLVKETKGFTGSMTSFFPLFENNVFLVGDAAGLNDPIFRAGTNQAMISGQIAGQVISNNNPEQYSAKIKSLPFVPTRIKKAADIFYNFDNYLLNEIGDILENKTFSDIKRIPCLIKFLLRKKTRQNIFNILDFLKTWKKAKKWLW